MVVHRAGRYSSSGADAGIEAIVEDLHSLGVETAPHVVHQLRLELGGDLATIREVAGSLAPAQRTGMRMLPDLLPCVPPISAEYSTLALADEDRELLLLAALITDAQVDALLRASGRSAANLLEEPIARHLDVSAGSFAFRDLRLRVWMRSIASPEAQAHAHARLDAVYAEHGDPVRSAWHRARGAVMRCPDVVPVLLPPARRLLALGRARDAFLLAAEIFDHALGDEADEARLIAGRAALAAGCAEDAVEWLRSLVVVPADAEASSASPAQRRREEALPAYIVADTLITGAVPILDPAERRPRSSDATTWMSWGRTAAMAAILCAERRSTSAMRLWLQEVRGADLESGAAGAIRDPAVALCWLLSGEEDAAAEGVASTLADQIVAALTAAVGGEPEAGLERLGAFDASFAEDPLLLGAVRSPFAEAYRAVTETLLLLWQGDVAASRRRLLAAAQDGPVGLPYAGLGVHLARHLDIAVHGSPQAFSLSLTVALAPGILLDEHVDHAVQAYLAGATETAGEHLRIRRDRAATGPVFSEGGLLEVGPLDAPSGIEPHEAALVRALCVRITGAAVCGWQREYVDIAEQSRRIRSPFRRGRVEALLGTTCAIRGDRAAGRRHLRLARTLFDDAGADAWRGSVDRRLAKLGEPFGDTGAPTTPIPVSAIDPLAACRAAWSQVLTDRELEVAMLIVDGAANKEIAEQLDLSIRTVEVHAGRVFDKLDVRRRVELTVLGHRTNQHV